MRDGIPGCVHAVVVFLEWFFALLTTLRGVPDVAFDLLLGACRLSQVDQLGVALDERVAQVDQPRPAIAGPAQAFGHSLNAWRDRFVGADRRQPQLALERGAVLGVVVADDGLWHRLGAAAAPVGRPGGVV